MQSATIIPTETTTRTQQLVELIRLDIVHNRLEPGARVTEEALADRYGSSRTPVREALRVLAREALLVHTPRAGYVVASINLDEMDDLYTMRVAIEERVAQRIVEAPRREPLEKLLEFWAAPAVAREDVSLVFADELFHETLADVCGSSVLLPILQNINHRVHALRIRDFANPERVRLTYEQHAAILRTLLDGDSRLAAALLKAHIWQSYAYVRGSMLGEVER